MLSCSFTKHNKDNSQKLNDVNMKKTSRGRVSHLMNVGRIMIPITGY